VTDASAPRRLGPKLPGPDDLVEIWNTSYTLAHDGRWVGRLTPITNPMTSTFEITTATAAEAIRAIGDLIEARMWTLSDDEKLAFTQNHAVKVPKKVIRERDHDWDRSYRLFDYLPADCLPPGYQPIPHRP
jgi:hypothetical protein